MNIYNRPEQIFLPLLTMYMMMSLGSVYALREDVQKVFVCESGSDMKYER